MHVHKGGEIPEYFNLWTILSMIAASVGDRVWFYRIRERPLYPNLYVILIGESGGNKSMAASEIASYIGEYPSVNFMQAHLTSQFLFDIMSGSKTEDGETHYIETPRVFLVQPELAFYFPKGKHAQALVETLTELYSGGSFTAGTRTSGACTIKNSCINWFAGSTKEWLVKTVSPEAIQSGFFARVAVVYPEKKEKKQGATNKYEADHYEVVEHIKARLLNLTWLSGEMNQTDEARKWVEGWLANRPIPDDPMILPAWRRQRELVYKLAMVLSLAERDDLKMDVQHVFYAEKLSRQLIEMNMPNLVEFSSRTPRTADTDEILTIIKRVKKIKHTPLLKMAYKRGIDGPGTRRAVYELKAQGLLKIEKTPTGGSKYEYIKP
jgi:hypothetical protein